MASRQHSPQSSRGKNGGRRRKTLFRSFRSMRLTLPCTLFSIHLSTHADLWSNQFVSRKSRSFHFFLFLCCSFACTAGCQRTGVGGSSAAELLMKQLLSILGRCRDKEGTRLSCGSVLLGNSMSFLCVCVVCVCTAGYDGRWHPHGTLDDSWNLHHVGLESIVRRRCRSCQHIARSTDAKRIHRLPAQGKQVEAGRKAGRPTAGSI